MPLGLLAEIRFYDIITWQRVLEQIIYTYDATLSWQLTGFWYVNAQCIRLILKDLKLEINQRLLKESRTTGRHTDDLRLLWTRLSSLIQQIGTMFVFTLVTRMFIMSSVLIVSVYFAFAPSVILDRDHELQHKSLDDLLRYHIRTTILFLLILFYFNTGYKIRKSATEDFQLQLLSIRPTKEQRMAGFEILSSAMTNFLIMEQFKLSEKQYHTARNHTHTQNLTNL
ncbi:unnamed protein product [Bemisia tabaci]|uniref:Gustatory receptor n=1 Tax=Bemisia tabaci TaxID=7038 RepID=A0A9P0F5C2_BEMTA|nr:unnamed protein product [Bemisia tabaci]